MASAAFSFGAAGADFAATRFAAGAADLRTAEIFRAGTALFPLIVGAAVAFRPCVLGGAAFVATAFRSVALVFAVTAGFVTATFLAAGAAFDARVVSARAVAPRFRPGVAVFVLRADVARATGVFRAGALGVRAIELFPKISEFQPERLKPV